MTVHIEVPRKGVENRWRLCFRDSSRRSEVAMLLESNLLFGSEIGSQPSMSSPVLRESAAGAPGHGRDQRRSVIRRPLPDHRPSSPLSKPSPKSSSPLA